MSKCALCGKRIKDKPKLCDDCRTEVILVDDKLLIALLKRDGIEF